MEAFKNGWHLEVCVRCSESALGVASIAALQHTLKCRGGKPSPFIFFFCTSQTTFLSGLSGFQKECKVLLRNSDMWNIYACWSRSRISELSKTAYLYSTWSGCLRRYCPTSGLQNASLWPVFCAGGGDQLFRQQMLSKELDCATSFLPASTKDAGGLWVGEKDGSYLWQQQFLDWVFISTSSLLFRFHIKVCFWQ